MLHIMKIDAIIDEKTKDEIEKVMKKAEIAARKKWKDPPLVGEELLSFYIAETIEKHLVADIEERIKGPWGDENVCEE